ncbi:hypothetical protein [Leptospira sarikeiensis]|uniref:Uncharacterized protein n=1 Tax=Leptospira sarikeiensis TaxID=2484943 RepID=A0A4R9KCJ9_9LEPT|nr:hypothetical protein [Leptospira sarikeiensis]TGL64652.1 hypothetical protein EHQ64_02045 [Leptospira sarikeiensis]
MKSTKVQKPITPFRLLFLIPLILFVATSFLGEFLRLYRLSEERSIYSSKSPIDQLVDDFNMERMFHKYGYDFRTRMDDEERSFTGTLEDNPLERSIPKFFFVLTILGYPLFACFQFLKEVFGRSKS